MFPKLAKALESRYEIDREIGAGGMATVFLARDLRHHRNVALKVLKPDLGAVLGGERFLAEIQVTANLQHPNLLPLFDSGEADGLLYYVMPFVEGESLRHRLQREKQLPIEEAVRIAQAVASALNYAHRHGVVHRDLKPENILMHEGQPVIADFGIALAVSNAGGERITQTGLSLGTPQYMSPEQATADRTVDGRTDLFSLGAITYEMLAGDPPHVASTAQAVIAKLLTERPTSVRVHRPNVPPHVDAAVLRALEKLPADRFATVKEFSDALDSRNATFASQPAMVPAVAAQPRRRSYRELAAWSLVALLAAGAGWSQYRLRHVPPVLPIRVNLDMPAGTRVNDNLQGSTIALSPDGQTIAFLTTNANWFRVYVRRIDEIAAHEISTLAARNLVFSPDGKWIAFTEGNLIKRIPMAGGEPVTVGATGGAVPYGLAWSPNGDSIFVGSFTGLYGLATAGGTAQRVAVRSGGIVQTGQNAIRFPALIANGELIAFTGGNSSALIKSQLGILERSTGKVTLYEQPVTMTLGMVDDYLVYVSTQGTIAAVRFDIKNRKVIGDPVQLEDKVLVDPTAGAKASLSASGTLTFLRGRAQFQPILLRSQGDTGVPLIRDPGSYATPRFSPDGQKIALTVAGGNVWIYDIPRNTLTRLTTDGQNLRPEWTPDGKDVMFIATRDNKPGIWKQAADGSGVAELFYAPEYEPFEALMSPDSRYLVYRTSPGEKFSRDIFAVDLQNGKKVIPIIIGPASETQPRLSPDGKWIAYQSSEGGRFEIYVRTFPENGAHIQVSDNGGSEPLWSRDNHALFYRGGNGEVVKVDISTSPGFSIGKRTTVLSGDYLTDASHPNYDVAPDGRLLMLRRAGEESQTIVVHNWATEVRAKLARK